MPEHGPRVALAGICLAATIFRRDIVISRPAFARIAPFAAFIALLALQALLEAAGAIDARAGQWLTVARGAVVAAILAWFWREYSELRGASPGRGNLFLAIGVGLAVFAAWITLDFSWATPGGGGGGFAPVGARGGIDWPLAALRLLALVLVVPPMEELFWRSFLMRWIDARDFLAADPRRASARAFVLCCALFALEHSLWLAGLVAGIAYAWLYMRSANLWIPIVSHAVTNASLGLWILATREWRFW